jgi:AcrR family transcriptional regulator
LRALVLAALERSHRDLMHSLDEAEASTDDPVSQLRARLLFLGQWVQQHAGLYKVLHESTLNQRTHMAFKEELGERTTAAIRRCMAAGRGPDDDTAPVSLDLRAAVHGAVSMRVNRLRATSPMRYPTNGHTPPRCSGRYARTVLTFAECRAIQWLRSALSR